MRKLNFSFRFQIIIPYRGEHYNVLRLRVCGDLGQVLFSPFHLKDEESIRKALTHSNVAFNLIGREFETRNFNFDDVHVHGARRLAKIARESGVKRFIHVSHVNAAENPKVREKLLLALNYSDFFLKVKEEKINFLIKWLINVTLLFILLQKLFLPKGSAWLRSKWLGEQAVLEEFPDATIIRSVDVYGRGDHFIE